tara:strand:+ start:365 stop:580 length:216 start_codon:yes stop_codon:yes gene_type:complete
LDIVSAGVFLDTIPNGFSMHPTSKNNNQRAEEFVFPFSLNPPKLSRVNYQSRKYKTKQKQEGRDRNSKTNS